MKVLTRQIGRYPTFGIDERGYQCLNTMFMVNVKDEACDPYALMAVLNSSPVRAIWLDQFYDRRRTFPKIKGTYLKRLPVPKRLVEDERAVRKLVTLVHERIDLARQALTPASSHEEEAIERLAHALDGRLDDAVSDLFELSDADRAVIQGMVAADREVAAETN